MKKVISVKEIMIILIGIMFITFSTSTFAINFNIGDNNTPTISAGEYENAQRPDVENNAGNNTGNNTTGNNTIGNNTTGNNTGNNLPKTGIEDYNIGILLIICIASAIYAYRKISDYRNI